MTYQANITLFKIAKVVKDQKLDLRTQARLKLIFNHFYLVDCILRGIYCQLLTIPVEVGVEIIEAVVQP